MIETTFPETASRLEILTLKPFGLLIKGSSDSPTLESLSVDTLKELARKFHLIVLRGFPFLDQSRFESYCKGWGALLEWNFGYVLNLFEQPAPQNYLFTSGNVPLHWDGAFTERVPEFQIFSCVESAGVNCGGETIFSNTPNLLDDCQPETVEYWRNTRLTYKTEKLAHYGGQFISPVVCTHPSTGQLVVRYGQPADRDTSTLNPFTVRAEGLTETEEQNLFRDLNSRLYDKRHCYEHEWLAGDYVIANNFTLLHGRRAFRSGCGRHIRRVHVL